MGLSAPRTGTRRMIAKYPWDSRRSQIKDPVGLKFVDVNPMATPTSESIFNIEKHTQFVYSASYKAAVGLSINIYNVPLLIYFANVFIFQCLKQL